MKATRRGMLAGALFFSYTSRIIEERGWTIQGLNQQSSKQALLLLLTLFVHSIPEGAAIGVGYATGEIKFGWLLAVAIAVHNIPEARRCRCRSWDGSSTALA